MPEFAAEYAGSNVGFADMREPGLSGPCLSLVAYYDIMLH
jgi:hypothetical protein